MLGRFQKEYFVSSLDVVYYIKVYSYFFLIQVVNIVSLGIMNGSQQEKSFYFSLMLIFLFFVIKVNGVFSKSILILILVDK